MNIATDLGKVVTNLQVERGEVAFYIFTNGSTLRTNLTQRFAITDEAINKMSIWTEIKVPSLLHGHGTENAEVMLNRSSFQTRLEGFRKQINSEESKVLDVMIWYMTVNNAMLDHLTNQIKETDKSGVWRYLIGFKNLLRSIESIGISAVYGIMYFGRGHLKTDSHINYIKYDVLGKDLLNSSLNYVPYLKKMYRNITIMIPEYGNIKNRLEYFYCGLFSLLNK